jgi:hypothetical protein
LILLSALSGFGGFGFLVCSSSHLPSNDNGTRGGHAGGGGDRVKMNQVCRG